MGLSMLSMVCLNYIDHIMILANMLLIDNGIGHVYRNTVLLFGRADTKDVNNTDFTNEWPFLS